MSKNAFKSIFATEQGRLDGALCSFTDETELLTWKWKVPV